MKGILVLAEKETNKPKLLIVNEPHRSLMSADGSVSARGTLPSVTAKLYPCDPTKVVSLAIRSTAVAVDGNIRMLAQAIALPLEGHNGGDQTSFDTLYGKLGFRPAKKDSPKRSPLKTLELLTNSGDVEVRMRHYEILPGRLLFIRSDKEEEGYELSDTPLAFIRSDKEEEDAYFLEKNVVYIRSDKEEE